MSEASPGATAVSRPTELFRRGTAAILTWAILAGLTVSLFFLIFGEPVPEVEPGQPDSYSRSAIGYRGLTRWLELQVPVLVSRGDSAAKASPRVPLLLLEPRNSEEGLRQLRRTVTAAMDRGATTVLVLPKWYGRADPSDPHGRVDWAVPRPTAPPSQVLAAALRDDQSDDLQSDDPQSDDRPSDDRPSDIVRSDRVTGWQDQLPATAGLEAPSLVGAQLLEYDDRFEPLLAAPEGILVAKVREHPLYVVADPDLLNTHGLARGDNAVYAHRLLVDHLRPTSFVIAEEIHGYAVTPSVWRALLRPPLVLLTLHLAGLALLVLWAGTGRFGRPLPLPPRVAPGKRTLIDNTAALLGLGGHYNQRVGQYLEWTVRRTARRFSLAAGEGLRRQVTRLARLGERRGVTVDLERTARSIVALGGNEPQRALALAHDLYRWRKEMEDGRTL